MTDLLTLDGPSGAILYPAMDDALAVDQHSAHAEAPPTPLTTDDRPPAGDIVPGVRVVLAGVDTLTVTVMGTLKPGVRAGLADLQTLVKAGMRDLLAALPSGLRAEVSPHGAKPVWSGILRGAWGSARWAKGDGVPQALEVQWSSMVCHRFGIAALLRVTEQWGRRWCFPGSRLLVNRVDLCADVEGLELSEDVSPSGPWVTRAKQRAPVWSGRRWTGTTFGSMPGWQVQCYDKTYEVSDAKAEWLHPMWREGGWSGRRVVRVEVRCTGRALREMMADLPGVGVRSVADGPTLGRALSGLWGYGLEWCSLREDDGTANRSRWPVATVWARLAALEWQGDDVRVHRAPVHRARSKPEGYASAVKVDGAGQANHNGVGEPVWVASLGGCSAAADIGATTMGALGTQVLGLLGALLGAEAARAGGGVPLEPERAAQAIVGRLVSGRGGHLIRAARRHIARKTYLHTDPDGLALLAVRTPVNTPSAGWSVNEMLGAAYRPFAEVVWGEALEFQLADDSGGERPWYHDPAVAATVRDERMRAKVRGSEET
jgi:hypothetical protein